MDLEPGGKTPVEVAIRVPSSASTGERYGMIWASLAANPNPAAGFNVVNRVGIRVYLDIGSGHEPPSDFTIGNTVPARDKDSEPSVTVEVTNTGGRALDISGKITLSNGPHAGHAGSFAVETGTMLAPGEPGTLTVRFPRDLPNGPWKVTVNMVSGMVKHAATGTITFPGEGQPGKPSIFASRSGSVWSPSHLTLAVGLVALLGRRSRSAAPDHTSARTGVPLGGYAVVGREAGSGRTQCRAAS